MILFPIIISLIVLFSAYFFVKKRIGADRGSIGVDIINRIVYGSASIGIILVFVIYFYIKS